MTSSTENIDDYLYSFKNSKTIDQSKTSRKSVFRQQKLISAFVICTESGHAYTNAYTKKAKQLILEFNQLRCVDVG